MGRLQIQEFVQNCLNKAGVAIDGPNPWDIQVRDPRFFERVMADGCLGLGEAYMESWWDSERVDECVYRLCTSGVAHKYENKWSALWHKLQAFAFNLQSKKRSFVVGEQHYDLGNDLFEKMLDKRMTYSCAYWKDASNLDDAQEAKLELICRKLHLQPGMKILDIGCGWGSFSKYAAEKYQAHVTGITISRQQLQLGKQMCEGLPVELLLQDYRDVAGSFDRVVSIGQMEHVGYKNYREYFRIVRRCLKENGLFLLHTIGNNVSVRYGDPWTVKYIFPNGMSPSIKQLSAAFEGIFQMEDWHNFGVYYDKTLLAWQRNFAAHWQELRHKYDERFYRMWNYYLFSCAGAFRARELQLWQIVLSKDGILGGYARIS